jgi:hypothetical protein
MPTCFRCGGSFRQVFRDGKLIDLDHGTDLPHVKTCKGREESRKARQGNLRLGDPNHHAAMPVTGTGFRPSCADCPALPWQPCPCYPEAA